MCCDGLTKGSVDRTQLSLLMDGTYNLQHPVHEYIEPTQYDQLYSADVKTPWGCTTSLIWQGHGIEQGSLKSTPCHGYLDRKVMAPVNGWVSAGKEPSVHSPRDEFYVVSEACLRQPAQQQRQQQQGVKTTPSFWAECLCIPFFPFVAHIL